MPRESLGAAARRPSRLAAKPDRAAAAQHRSTGPAGTRTRFRSSNLESHQIISDDNLDRCYNACFQ